MSEDAPTWAVGRTGGARMQTHVRKPLSERETLALKGGGV
jgi:hypothetical protein